MFNCSIKDKEQETNSKRGRGKSNELPPRHQMKESFVFDIKLGCGLPSSLKKEGHVGGQRWKETQSQVPGLLIKPTHIASTYGVQPLCYTLGHWRLRHCPVLEGDRRARTMMADERSPLMGGHSAPPSWRRKGSGGDHWRRKGQVAAASAFTPLQPWQVRLPSLPTKLSLPPREGSVPRRALP